MQQYLEDVEQYGPDADPNARQRRSPGTTPAFVTVDALNRAAAMEGGLTRANLMNAFWSIDIEPPLALGGVAQVDGVTDAYTAEFGVMSEFDPAGPSYKDGRGRRDRRRGRGRALRRLTPQLTPVLSVGIGPFGPVPADRFART